MGRRNFFQKKRHYLIFVGLLALMFLQSRNRSPLEKQLLQELHHIETSDAATVQDKVQQQSSTQIRPIKNTPTNLKLPPEIIANHRSQMKLALVTLYTSEKTFFSEFGRYSTDLRGIGWMPQGGSLAYRAGFFEAYQPESPLPEEDPRYMNTDLLVAEDNSKPGYSYGPTAAGFTMNDLEKYCEGVCTAEAKKFHMVAAANLDDDPTLDVWLISDDKTIKHLIDDLQD